MCFSEVHAGDALPAETLEAFCGKLPEVGEQWPLLMKPQQQLEDDESIQSSQRC